MRFIIRLIAVGLLASGLSARAQAETTELRVAVQYGLQYLPLLIMQHDELIEDHVEAAGLPRPTVTWNTFSGGDVLAQALLSGHVDIINGGLSAFLTLWSKTEGTQQVLGIAPFNSLPVVLVTHDPRIQSIEDYTEDDRIALPSLLSGNSLLLQMEAEKVLGSWDALNHLTVARSQPDAYAAFMDDTSGISSHFGNSPYTEMELEKPGAHIVLRERDVLGGDTFSGGLSQTTLGFYQDNPMTTQAFFEALVEAMAIIETDKVRAAEIYITMMNDRTNSVDDIVALLSREDMIFDIVPLNMMQFADFMHRIGQIDVPPESWRELFLPYVQDFEGS